MVAGAAKIRVTFQIDADGLLSVSAKELSANKETSITVKPSYGLADDEIARMLQDSYGAADEDMKHRALREEQVEAERIVLATESALNLDQDLLSASEKDNIHHLLSDVREKAQGKDHHSIKEAVEALAKGTEDFAARRMDRNVRNALTGRKLDEIA
jgi:molecular chaperone HscA